LPHRNLSQPLLRQRRLLRELDTPVGSRGFSTAGERCWCCEIQFKFDFSVLAVCTANRHSRKQDDPFRN
jgi:hypothetical protein